MTKGTIAMKFCDGITRRDSLQVGLMGGLGLSLSNFLRLSAAEENKQRTATADAVLFINLAGGVSHLDTLDMKRKLRKRHRENSSLSRQPLPGYRSANIFHSLQKLQITIRSCVALVIPLAPIHKGNRGYQPVTDQHPPLSTLRMVRLSPKNCPANHIYLLTWPSLKRNGMPATWAMPTPLSKRTLFLNRENHFRCAGFRWQRASRWRK